jgi:hypothetical protein
MECFQLIPSTRNHMESKSLLNLMWKASIDSNWSKEAHLGPREFVEVTKASPNSTSKDPHLDQRVLSSNTIGDPKP